MRVRVVPATPADTVLTLKTPLADTAAAPPAAAPAEFVVDTTSDAVRADPSDGPCCTTSGECSLRAVVMAANARPSSKVTLSPGHERLTIPPDSRLIIGDHPDPTTGDLNVDAPTTIHGTGARSTIIDTNRLDRAFRLRADTHVSDVTITDGRAEQRQLPFTDTGGGGIANAGHLTLPRVAVTGNSAGYGGGVFNIPDAHLDLADREKAFATLTSLGHNIDGDSSCRLSAVGHLPSRDPLVGPLANHGGPTDTVALLPGSPALDAAERRPATDQRGVPRPQGATCDIGAYEHTP
ncbi:choice-of-anchor Q domain-containing protein [Streptomyces massasporeus]|uniref:choice-of-anchor Q domain-containing protein n=1 Tax=Streptomyces massasporeus TaxID=67324 RepID=UPI003403CFF9